MPVYRLNVVGTAPWGRWSHGHYVFSALTAAQLAAVGRDAVQAMWSGGGTPDLTLAAWYPTTTGVTYVDVWLVDAQNRQTGPVARQPVSGGAFGTRTDGFLPANVAVCMTWRSSQPGKSGRGRTYLPPPSPATVGNNGRIGPDDAFGAFLESSRRFAQTLNAQASIGASPPGLGGVYPWLTVGCADRFDSQRRRADSIREGRQDLPLT